MKTIPKRVLNLLKRRYNFAMKLLDVGAQIDDYCEKIGLDLSDCDNALISDVKIYCEPWTAYTCTRQAIENKLNEVTEE